MSFKQNRGLQKKTVFMFTYNSNRYYDYMLLPWLPNLPNDSADVRVILHKTVYILSFPFFFLLFPSFFFQ